MPHQFYALTPGELSDVAQCKVEANKPPPEPLGPAAAAMKLDQIMKERSGEYR